MVESDWTHGHSGGGAAPKSMSVWGKVAIGCGTAMLCVVLAIGSLAYWGVKKAGTAMDEGWAELHEAVESLRTEAGCKALYLANPGLAEGYPTEAEFLEAGARWRTRLGELPAERPGFEELFASQRGGDFRLLTHRVDGQKVVEIHMRLSTGATLVVERQGEQLTELRID